MTSHSPHKSNLILGAIYVILCYLCLALFSACAKVASESVSAFTVLFFQNSFCFLLNLPSALHKGLRTQHPYLHLIRDVFGFASYFLFVLSVKYIPLANAVLLSNSAPLWIPFIIWIWFKKKVPFYLWGSIILGFVGLLFILKPDLKIFDVASLLALVSGILIGVAMVAIGRLTYTEPAPRVLFYYFLLGLIISLPGFIKDFSAAFHLPVLYFLICAALLFYLVQFFITRGFRYGKTSTLSPLAYTVVLFSAILDRLFWHKVPDFWSLIGMVLVIAGGVISVYLEKKYEGKYI